MLLSRFKIPRTLIGREAQLKEASGDRSRVVVADYHPLWRQALSGLLREQLGLEVVAEAADGREAVDCCRHLGPDAVIMDVGWLDAVRSMEGGGIRRFALAAGSLSPELSVQIYIILASPPQHTGYTLNIPNTQS